MAVINARSLILVSLFFSIVAHSGSISEYNHALFAYEKKIGECGTLKNKKFNDVAPSGLKDQDVRIALMYFILKTSEECSENSKQDLIEAINQLEVTANVSDFIQSNAKGLLITFKDNEERLNNEKYKFLKLDSHVQKMLKKIEAFSRPFDPTMALEHYIDRRK